MKKIICLMSLVCFVAVNLFGQSLHEIRDYKNDDRALAAIKKMVEDKGPMSEDLELWRFVKNRLYKTVRFLIEEQNCKDTKKLLGSINPKMFICGVGAKVDKSVQVSCKNNVKYVTSKTSDENLEFSKYLLTVGSVVTPESVINTVHANELDRFKFLINNYKGENDLPFDMYLYKAAESGFIDIVKYLIEEKSMDPNTEWNGSPAVHQAVKNTKLVKYFLEVGADLNVKDRNNTTLVMKSVSNHACYDTAVHLLSLDGVDVSTVNKQGHDLVSYNKMSFKRDKTGMKKYKALFKEYNL